MRRSIVIMLLLFIPWMAQGQTVDALLSQADSLYANYEEPEALEIYKQVLELNPDEHLALWRTSLLYARIGNRLDSEDEKRSYFKDAKLFAQQALAVDSTSEASHYVMGVAMGRMALISGARERVAASRKIREHALKALELDAQHAGAHHLMGRWHYKVANLNFAERMAADYLFGGIPGEASNQQAIAELSRAVELEPRNVMYHYDLAQVLVDEDQYDQAQEHLQQALELETKNPDDRIYKPKARRLLKDIR
ncbi:MAG: tetratricopeptide repeat protein [Bacteroidota bacterium]